MATTKAANGRNGQKARPVFAQSFFPVQVAVFEHPSDNGRPNFSIRLSRSFRRDEQSDWETTEYLGPEHLLPAARLLAAAYDAIQERQQRAHRERQEANQEVAH